MNDLSVCGSDLSPNHHRPGPLLEPPPSISSSPRQQADARPGKCRHLRPSTKPAGKSPPADTPSKLTPEKPSFSEVAVSLHSLERNFFFALRVFSTNSFPGSLSSVNTSAPECLKIFLAISSSISQFSKTAPRFPESHNHSKFLVEFRRPNVNKPAKALLYFYSPFQS